MSKETHHTNIEVDGMRFALIFQNDGETFQTLIYRADAIELFDIESDIVRKGNYATKTETVEKIRELTYLWEN
jgi:hypothetical protein